MEIVTLWLREYPALVRYLQGLTKSKAEAEDFAQAAYVRALEHVDAISEMSPEHARAWLMLTARRLFIDEMRRRKPTSEWQEANHPTYEENFSGIHVEQWLDSLPQNLRQVVTLRHIEGYTSREIGEMLSLPSATIRTRLRAAVTLLRQYETQNA